MYFLINQHQFVSALNCYTVKYYNWFVKFCFCGKWWGFLQVTIKVVIYDGGEVCVF